MLNVEINNLKCNNRGIKKKRTSENYYIISTKSINGKTDRITILLIIMKI